MTTDWPTAAEVIEAIRSGQYLWGFGTLSSQRYDGVQCFCIAGIAADLATDRELGRWERNGDGYHWIDNDDGLEWFSSLPEDFVDFTFHGENNLAQLIRAWDNFATWLPDHLTPDFMADYFAATLESYGVVV